MARSRIRSPGASPASQPRARPAAISARSGRPTAPRSHSCAPSWQSAPTIDPSSRWTPMAATRSGCRKERHSPRSPRGKEAPKARATERSVIRGGAGYRLDLIVRTERRGIARRSDRQKHRDDGHGDTDPETGEPDLPSPSAVSSKAFSVDHLMRLADLTEVEDAAGPEAGAELQPCLEVTRGGHGGRDCDEKARQGRCPDRHEDCEQDDRGD